MIRPDTRADFDVPAAFADSVMQRVATAPAPMPARTFWAAVRDRSAFDVLGALTVAWRLAARGGATPVLVRAQALAVIVLVAASLAGGTTIVAAAAYRTVAPFLIHDRPLELLTEATPTDVPDATRAPTPIVIAAPDHPDGRPVGRTVAVGGAAAVRPADAPGRDRAPKAAEGPTGGREEDGIDPAWRSRDRRPRGRPGWRRRVRPGRRIRRVERRRIVRRVGRVAPRHLDGEPRPVGRRRLTDGPAEGDHRRSPEVRTYVVDAVAGVGHVASSLVDTRRPPGT